MKTLATELRIGNLLQHKSGKIIKLESFTNKVFYYNEDDVLFLAKIEDFEPETLTEEWLLKFGFEHREFSLDKGSFFLSKRTGKKEYLYQAHKKRFQVKYVHQLQNLYFALTGEELK